MELYITEEDLELIKKVKDDLECILIFSRKAMKIHQKDPTFTKGFHEIIISTKGVKK